MPTVHYVKKARKENPVAKVGEPYYWWKFRFGGKRFSKTYPLASQLTQSEFLSTLYSIGEWLGSLTELTETDLEDLRNQLDELLSTCQDNFDNIPEQLQDGPAGEILQERIDELESYISELDQIDFENPDEKPYDIAFNNFPSL